MLSPTVTQVSRHMRLFDCFPFFNELDLLEIRLNELAPVVDRFVIAESTTTFSGLPKPLYYADNRERFAAFGDRVEHVVVDIVDDPAVSAWARRRQQCNAMMRSLQSAAGDDLVLMSDVDEIVRADALRAMMAHPPKRGEVVCFELRMANFFVNLESGARWIRSGPRAARRSAIKTMEGLRKVRGPVEGVLKNAVRGLRACSAMRRPIRRRLVRDAGWHFSYLGGVEAIHAKMRSFVGYDNVPPDITDSEQLQLRIDEARPISYSRAGLTYRDLDESFPAYLRQNRERFAHLIADRATYRRDHLS